MSADNQKIATHEVELIIGIDINKIVNEQTIDVLADVFNTDKPDEILARYGNLLVEELVGVVSKRKEYVGYDARLNILATQPVDDDVTDDSLIAGDIDGNEPDDSLIGNNNAVVADNDDNLNLLESIFVNKQQLVFDGYDITGIDVNNLFDISAEDIELDTGIEAKYCGIKSLDDCDYILYYEDKQNDKEKFAKKYDLVKGEVE